MKRATVVLIISASMLPSLGAQASEPVPVSCQQAVSTFLVIPEESTFVALSGLDDTACWEIVGSSNTNLDQLNEWTRRGNQWAAQYLATHLKQLDGGNLEDALEALGEFSDHDMERLLMLTNKGMLSDPELTDALTMLPFSLVDNFHDQLDCLKARRQKLTGVTRKDLLEQRKYGLKAIDGFMSEIMRITRDSSQPEVGNER